MASVDLTTVDRVKNLVELPVGDFDLDVLLPDLITGASVAIMNHCKREFAPKSNNVARRFDFTTNRVDLSPYDLRSVTAVKLHPEQDSPVTLGTDQYMLKPFGAVRGVYTTLQLSDFLVVVSQTIIRFGFGIIEITGDWGFPSVPADIERACNITVASWATHTTNASSYGVPMDASGGGVTFRNDWDLPWAAVKLMGRYRRGNSRWAT